MVRSRVTLLDHFAGTGLSLIEPGWFFCMFPINHVCTYITADHLHVSTYSGSQFASYERQRLGVCWTAQWMLNHLCFSQHWKMTFKKSKPLHLFSKSVVSHVLLLWRIHRTYWRQFSWGRFLWLLRVPAVQWLKSTGTLILVILQCCEQHRNLTASKNNRQTTSSLCQIYNVGGPAIKFKCPNERTGGCLEHTRCPDITRYHWLAKLTRINDQ